jgi:hypothetical protein
MIKIPISQAKKLGFSIKGYVFDKNSKVPIPVIQKAKNSKKRKKRSKMPEYEVIKNVYKIKIKEI